MRYLMQLTEYNHLSLEKAANKYAEMGFVITPLQPKSKAAKLDGWNIPGKTIDVKEHWGFFPADNIGLILEPSKICILDIDCKDEFLIAVKSIGLDPNDGEKPFWETATAGIVSGKPNRGKLVFRLPDQIKLAYHKLQWNDAGGGRHTVFELRTGYVQDVLPPSIHPDTKAPYKWVGNDILPLPHDLLLLWQHWDTFEPALQKADRFYKEPKVAPRRGRPRKVSPGRDIIKDWIALQNLGALLEYYGYKRIGHRFLSPNSHSGTPGIIISEHGDSFYAFNESDAFADGHQHNAFDLILDFEYKGDIRAAIGRCKADLGISEIKDKDLLETARRLIGEGGA